MALTISCAYARFAIMRRINCSCTLRATTDQEWHQLAEALPLGVNMIHLRTLLATGFQVSRERIYIARRVASVINSP